ncbi:hypothetical protein BH10CHL1_BH10CHL1_02360 [soil metagenome]
MRYYRRYRRRNRYEDDYDYPRSHRRGARIGSRELKWLAIGIVIFVAVAILFHMGQ